MKTKTKQQQKNLPWQKNKLQLWPEGKSFSIVPIPLMCISWIIIQISHNWIIRFNYKQVTTWLNVYIYDNDWIMRFFKSTLILWVISLKLWCDVCSFYDTFPWQKGVKLTNVRIILVLDSFLIWILDSIIRSVPIGFHHQSYEMQLILTIVIAHNKSWDIFGKKNEDFA